MDSKHAPVLKYRLKRLATTTNNWIQR